MSETQHEVNQILNDMFQRTVWGETIRSFNELSEEQQQEILREFERIYDDHGAEGRDMFDFLHSITMRFSKTYYFINTFGSHNSPKWDEALKDELS